MTAHPLFLRRYNFPVAPVATWLQLLILVHQRRQTAPAPTVLNSANPATALSCIGVQLTEHERSLLVQLLKLNCLRLMSTSDHRA